MCLYRTFTAELRNLRDLLLHLSQIKYGRRLSQSFRGCSHDSLQIFMKHTHNQLSDWHFMRLEGCIDPNFYNREPAVTNLLRPKPLFSPRFLATQCRHRRSEMNEEWGYASTWQRKDWDIPPGRNKTMFVKGTLYILENQAGLIWGFFPGPLVPSL